MAEAKKAATIPGIVERKFFTENASAIELPDLISHQKQSWKEFVEEGLGEVFAEVNPVDDFTAEKLSLTFKDYYFGEPKHTEAEVKDRNTTFDAPLYVTLELKNKVTGENKIQKDFYLGEYPWMTEKGTFIINGIERVIVSQLLRSPGTYFSEGDYGYSAKLIPNRGSWLEFETKNDGVIYVMVDKHRRMPFTTLLRALGVAKNSEIVKLFEDVDTGATKYVKATLNKDTTKTQNEALIEVYRRIRPGDLATVDNAKTMIQRMFFDFKRFDIGKVGRYKINQRLGLDRKNDIDNRILIMDDLFEMIREIIRLNNGIGEADDIDALHNRRVRMVGELVARQFRIGFARCERNIRDRMAQADIETVTPSQLINPRPISAAVREFFLTSQLSQFMDQSNPISELAQKRHLTSTGPGGIARDRAGYETRDVHATHYGRICVAETPEGGAIGLVLNLAAYAKINEYGFIEAPYIKVKDGKITGEVVYLDAAQEEKEVIADSSNEVKDGKLVSERIAARRNLQPAEVDVADVTYIDASHAQTLGSTAGMIPFVERNLIGRVLTGSNMQRQAVPLVKTTAATVGTGVEHSIAINSGELTVAEKAGEVVKADANEVQVKYGAKEVKSYKLQHFVRSNDSGSFNDKVVVKRGDKVVAGQPLIEGASIADGEMALGRDVNVAFMPWGGYNMDDSIIISERLIKEDELTNIHIDVETVDIRETKLGDEIVTRDIPNVSEEAIRNLDEDGIITVGSEVKTGDVLVGKITPKGEQELSSEERLLRAIFGEKAKDVRDTSKRVGLSQGGRVIGVKIFDKAHGDELKSGVLQQIQVFIAQTRKIQVGDKLAGRYGNKGIVAKVLPVEDMPFDENGTPIDMILNPLGVPSRSNLGQLFEVHIGAAAKKLGYKVASPSFDGIDNATIASELKKAGLREDGKVQLYDGRTGEPFQEQTTVGSMYMIKLHHMVADKIHARSTGPYAMVTQQPLGGKAQNGGQRLGEMEVWALEAYGAASILQEMITIKSDDVIGRSKAYESIIKDQEIQGPSIPEGFNVLVKEMQGLGLKVDLVENGQMIDAEEVVASTDASAPIELVEDDKESVLDEADDLGELDGMEVEIAEEFEDDNEENNDNEEEA